MADWTPPADAVEVSPSSSSSFTPPSDAVETKASESTTALGAAGRGFAEGAAPAVGGFAGFGAGMKAAAGPAAKAAEMTPGGPMAKAIVGGAIELGGGLVGAGIAAGTVQKVEDWVHQSFFPDDWKKSQQAKQEHPVASEVGSIASNAIGLSPFAAAEQAGRVMTKPLVQRATSAALMGGITGAEQAANGKFDPKEIAVSAATGAVLPGFNPLGKVLSNMGEHIVSAAFRSKTTGKIEPSGDAHDIPKKADPDLEQGFLDEKGDFLTRMEAYKKAKEAGQVPPGKDIGRPEEGLHTGDLKKAGEAAVDSPKPPVTREEHKTRIGEIDSVLKEIQDNPSDPRLKTEKPLALQKERQALLESMPKPKVKNKEHLTLEEGKDVLYGAKTVGEALTKLSDGGYGTKGQRLLVGLLQKSGIAKDRPFRFVDHQLRDPDNKNKLWAGMFDPVHNQVIMSGKYELSQSDVIALSKQAGKSTGEVRKAAEPTLKARTRIIRDVLHETVHAASHDILNDPNSVHAVRIKALYDYVKGKSTPEQLKLYGLTNEHEFLAEAASNDRFQAHLQSMEMPENWQKSGGKGSAWDSFKDVIKNFIASKFPDHEFPKEAHTAFDEAMDIGSHIVEAKKEDIESAVNSRKLFPPKDIMTMEEERAYRDKQEQARNLPAEMEADKDKIVDFLQYKQDKSRKELDTKISTIVQDMSPEDLHILQNDILTTPKSTLIPKEMQVDFYSWAKDTYGSKEVESMIGEGREYEMQREYLHEIKADTEGRYTDREKAIAELRLTGKRLGPRPLPTEMASDKDIKAELASIDPRQVKDEADFMQKAGEIYSVLGKDAALQFLKDYKTYKETWNNPVNEVDKLVQTNLNNKMAAERNISNTVKDMTEEAPKLEDREAITEAIDKGKTSTLSGKLKKVADSYISKMRDIGERAKKSGTVTGLLENYVTHIVDWQGIPEGIKDQIISAMLGEGKGAIGVTGMSPDSRFGKMRSFKTFEDLQGWLDHINQAAEAGGSKWRLNVKTKDIAEIYKLYSRSMEKAIENKKLIEALKTVRDVEGETQVRAVTDPKDIPRGWEQVPSKQFVGYVAHPDLIPALKFAFDEGPGSLMKGLGTVSQVAKRMTVIGSLFHAKTLMEVLSSSKIPLWTPIKEVGLGAIDKLAGTKFSGLTKAVDQFRKGGMGDNVDQWIKSGLVLTPPEDVSLGVLGTVGKFSDEMIGKYGPKTRVMEKALSTVEKYTLHQFDKFTWDYMHTGGKLLVADSYLTKQRMEAAKQGKPFDEEKARSEITSFVNKSFGGLNWFAEAREAQTKFGKQMAMAAYSPSGRRAMQIVLYAPDWTISTVKAFTAALPKELNPTKWHPVEGIKGMHNPTTKADYARLYQLKTAITFLTLINAFNMMTAGRPIWKNKDPTRIEYKDGTSVQAMKHASEPYHWITDPMKTLTNKLGFLPKAAIIGSTALEYPSPYAEKLVDPSALGRAKAIGKMALPFQAQAAMSAPSGEGAKRAAMGTLGFPELGMNAQQRKVTKAERAKAQKQSAKEYHKKAKAMGWE